MTLRSGKMYTPKYEFDLDTDRGRSFTRMIVLPLASPGELFIYVQNNKFIRASDLSEHTVTYQDRNGFEYLENLSALPNMFEEIG